MTISAASKRAPKMAREVAAVALERGGHALGVAAMKPVITTTGDGFAPRHAVEALRARRPVDRGAALPCVHHQHLAGVEPARVVALGAGAREELRRPELAVARDELLGELRGAAGEPHGAEHVGEVASVGVKDGLEAHGFGGG
jgi:hypothetical protein